MPPLVDDIVPGVIDGYGRIIGQATSAPGPVLDMHRVVDADGFEGKEVAAPPEEELNLVAKVDAMQMEASRMRKGQEGRVQKVLEDRDAPQPIVQFPEEDNPGEGHGTDNLQITMTADMMMHMQQLQAKATSTSSGGRVLSSKEMIPAMRNLSNLQVSFGSASDTPMPPADSVLGKRGAEESEVQGERLELSLGLNYGAKEDGGMLKKGKKQSVEQDLSAARSVELVYKRNKKQTATGHEPSGKLARPNVWSRQGQ
jgi:hypothetical protein